MSCRNEQSAPSASPARPARSAAFHVSALLGIPLGGILAALIAPAIAVTAGWRWAVGLTVALLVAVIWLVQRGRSQWDAERDRSATVRTSHPLAGVRTIWEHRSLRLASLAGACFSWGQFCTATFAVVACVEALDMSLVAAGTVLTVVQVSSAAGRVLVGWAVDHVRQVALVLAWVAGVMGDAHRGASPASNNRD